MKSVIFKTDGTQRYIEDCTTGSDDDQQNVLLSEEVDHTGEFFKAQQDGMQEGTYVRVIPAVFASDEGDLFMRSMLTTYALEAKNKDGSPSGKFWMDELGAKQAAFEVLESHKGMKGEELQKYMDTYFPRTWNHFDVNRNGSIEVVKMPQLMRFLASDQSMSLE